MHAVPCGVVLTMVHVPLSAEAKTWSSSPFERRPTATGASP